MHIYYNYTVVKNQPSQLYWHSRETGQSEMDFRAKQVFHGFRPQLLLKSIIKL